MYGPFLRIDSLLHHREQSCLFFFNYRLITQRDSRVSCNTRRKSYQRVMYILLIYKAARRILIGARHIFSRTFSATVDDVENDAIMQENCARNIAI